MWDSVKLVCIAYAYIFICLIAGNDNLAALTGAKQYVLRVDLGDWDNNRRWAEYDNFRVLGAADKYQLFNLGAYSGDAGKFSLLAVKFIVNVYNK